MSRKLNSTEEINKIKELLPKLNYDPKTGANYWKKSGKRAGAKRKGGFRIISNIYEHRINFYRECGHLPQYLMIINKSIYQDGSCKLTPDNMRPSSLSEIFHFRKVEETEPFTVKGVSWNERTGMFTAQIKKNGKKYHLGSFEDVAGAKRAYESASKRLYGEF